MAALISALSLIVFQTPTDAVSGDPLLLLWLKVRDERASCACVLLHYIYSPAFLNVCDSLSATIWPPRRLSRLTKAHKVKLKITFLLFPLSHFLKCPAVHILAHHPHFYSHRFSFTSNTHSLFPPSPPSSLIFLASPLISFFAIYLGDEENQRLATYTRGDYHLQLTVLDLRFSGN